MSSVPGPDEIRRELGLVTPPFRLNDFRRYLGATIRTEPGVRGGGLIRWHLEGGFTVILPPGTHEHVREVGSHELGHIANGDVGAHQAVLYARGSGRAAPMNPAVEGRATNWGIDALIGRGPLGIAIGHEEIKSAGALARRFLVTQRFIVAAAVRYGLDHLILRNPDSYWRYVRSVEWIRRSTEMLLARRVCERACCGAPSETMQHTRFDRLGREQRDDVEALCRRCYEAAELGSALISSQLVLLPEG
jgi:hypothetical protein